MLPAIKLRRVPDAMSTATAATFGLNAQTAYAMLRKAELSAGKTALIFGASSNTSLFLAGGGSNHDGECRAQAARVRSFRRAGDRSPLDAHRIVRAAMFRNLSLISNGIGTHDDLTRALNDYRNDQLSAVVDRVYQGGISVGAFFDRTFNTPDRFGKVVYLYGDAH